MSNIKDFFKKTLANYDENIKEYNDFINSKDISIIDASNTIKINGKEFNYENLGIFEPKSKVWLWSWSIPSYKSKDIQISRSLLEYGIEIEYTDTGELVFFLKTLLINSRHYIQNKFLLDLLLALSLSLIKSKCKFIYPRKRKDNSIDFLLIK